VIGGLCSLGQQPILVGMSPQPLAESRPERSVVDCAANLEQETGTARRARLLRFVHAPIDQKVCSSLGDGNC
jgi:hypothetical protein